MHFSDFKVGKEVFYIGKKKGKYFVMGPLIVVHVNKKTDRIIACDPNHTNKCYEFSVDASYLSENSALNRVEYLNGPLREKDVVEVIDKDCKDFGRLGNVETTSINSSFISFPEKYKSYLTNQLKFVRKGFRIGDPVILKNSTDGSHKYVYKRDNDGLTYTLSEYQFELNSPCDANWDEIECYWALRSIDPTEIKLNPKNKGEGVFNVGDKVEIIGGNKKYKGKKGVVIYSFKQYSLVKVEVRDSKYVEIEYLNKNLKFISKKFNTGDLVGIIRDRCNLNLYRKGIVVDTRSQYTADPDFFGEYYLIEPGSGKSYGRTQDIINWKHLIPREESDSYKALVKKESSPETPKKSNISNINSDISEIKEELRNIGNLLNEMVRYTYPRDLGCPGMTMGCNKTTRLLDKRSL